MKLNFLPNEYLFSLENIDLSYLYELRLRTGYPVKINYKNEYFYLSKDGLSKIKNNEITCKKEDIDYIINQITEHSIYAFNDRLREGYITTLHGIRVGIAGECVFDNGNIHTIKNISSLNIRIPHEINGCSNKIMPFIYCDNNVNNTIIISPPFLGKTTLLKDIIINLNILNFGSILVIDERGEFSMIKGENIDNIKYSNKSYAFDYGLRSMSPKIVVTDELTSKDDWLCVKKAINSGIKIIASCHSDNIENLKNKPFFINNLFDNYIVLNNCANFGQANCVYDKEFNLLCDCF